MTPLIEVRGLRYQYADGTLALEGIDFDLFAGETVAVLGANGSGKTTFVLHLNGLLFGQGYVKICDTPVSKATLARIRAKVGLVFQDSDEQLFMPTVLEDAAFGPLNLGISQDAALALAHECLRRVGLEHAAQKAPYHLSAGEKRRAAIAGVLAMSPDILILDEPTTFLDPPGQKLLVSLLRSLPQAKLIVTHDIYFAAAMASRAVFFEHGRIVGEGTVEQIVRQFDWQTDFAL